MNKLIIPLIILFIAQLAVPIAMIIGKEDTKNSGQVVYFHVEPVDPYDAFRGRYLNIGLVDDRVMGRWQGFREDQTIYVLIETDPGDFARFVDISSTPYSEEDLYMECKVNDMEEDYISIRPPFNRFYLNEEYAPMGEELFTDQAWIAVSLKDGDAVILDMYLDGMEIHERIDQYLLEN